MPKGNTDTDRLALGCRCAILDAMQIRAYASSASVLVALPSLTHRHSGRHEKKESEAIVGAIRAHLLPGGRRLLQHVNGQRQFDRHMPPTSSVPQ